jgi:crotonobetainyl-CoA:carnitine CoA-transferase CaiB-like acyl-CoA transferase
MTAGAVALREWQAFCAAVERPEWVADERFRSTAGLVRHADARLELMADVLRTRTTAEWLERLDRAQVPCAPILSREELLAHPQVLENAIVVESEHPNTGRMRQARPPERFERTPSAIGRAAPLLGEHTEEVLAESGYTAAAIEALRAEGAIGG